MAADDAGADLLLLAAGVIGLALLLRPTPATEPSSSVDAAFVLPVPSSVDAAFVLPVPSSVDPAFFLGPFSPELDLNPVVVTPFVEHGPLELVPAIVDEMPLSSVPILVDSMPLSLVPIVEPWVEPWPAGPWTIEEWEPWIRSRPVVQAYPQLTGMLRDGIERDLVRRDPGVVPWRAEAVVENYAHDAYGWARSAASTPIGTPTDPGVPDTRPFPYNTP